MIINIKKSNTRHDDYFRLSKAKKKISNNYFLAKSHFSLLKQKYTETATRDGLEEKHSRNLSVPNAARWNAQSKSLKNTHEKVRFH